MQPTHSYSRGVPQNSYRFIGQNGISLKSDGLDAFTEDFILRTTTDPLRRASALFPRGAAHPDTANYPDFYVQEITGAKRIPSWPEKWLTGSVVYMGVADIATRPITEEYGVYINEKFFARTAPTTRSPVRRLKRRICEGET